MLVNIIDRALLRLKRYPDRGELYYEILTKQFIYRDVYKRQDWDFGEHPLIARLASDEERVLSLIHI